MFLKVLFYTTHAYSIAKVSHVAKIEVNMVGSHSPLAMRGSGEWGQLSNLRQELTLGQCSLRSGHFGAVTTNTGAGIETGRQR